MNKSLEVVARFGDNSYVEDIGIAEGGQELSDDVDPGRQRYLGSQCGRRWSSTYNKGKSDLSKKRQYHIIM
jgi:hypothetical protein